MTRCVPASLFVLLLAACGDPAGAFVGTYTGPASVTAGTRTVSKTGPVSISPAAKGGVTVTMQLPMPTPDSMPPSSACDIPAKAAGNGDLQLEAYDCPPVTIAGTCAMTLKIATGTGKISGNALTIEGSGTLLAKACGQGGADVTESFTFKAPVNK